MSDQIMSFVPMWHLFKNFSECRVKKSSQRSQQGRQFFVWIARLSACKAASRIVSVTVGWEWMVLIISSKVISSPIAKAPSAIKSVARGPMMCIPILKYHSPSFLSTQFNALWIHFLFSATHSGENVIILYYKFMQKLQKDMQKILLLLKVWKNLYNIIVVN